MAEYADLSQTGIARIENGTNKPNSTTLNKIMTAFEQADIEFIGDSGVQKKKVQSITYRGKDGFEAFIDKLYKTARDTGGDFCFV